MTRKSRSVERDFLFQTIMEQIAIQGIAGCYHETAARGYFADREIEVLPCLSFDELFARMAADPALLGIAAIENTIAGSLLPNHELLQQSRARIIGEQKLRISHVLAALPGQTPDDIAEVRSHPIALMQCGDFLKTLPGMKIVERDDTAGSAREIAEGRLAGTAAICGADAARLYGLEILGASRPTNTTSHASSCSPTSAAPRNSPIPPTPTKPRCSSPFRTPGGASPRCSPSSRSTTSTSPKYSRCPSSGASGNTASTST